MAEPVKPAQKPKRLPRFYENVIKAIADLKEPSGSTMRTIANQVQGVVNATKSHSRCKDVTTHVERALKYALKQNVVSCNKGRYKLLTAKERASLPAGGNNKKQLRKRGRPAKVLAKKTRLREAKRKYNRRPAKNAPHDVHNSSSETSFASTVPKKSANKNMLDFTSCSRYML